MATGAEPIKDAVSSHWQGTYAARPTEELSWTEEVPETSLAMIAEARLPRTAPILDVGGGASRLAAELIGAGHSDVTVADISTEALRRAESDLGQDARRVRWIEADVRKHDFGRRFDLWHDRAVFHFMVGETDRDGYLSVLKRTLKPGGHLVLAAFGPDGPTRCSNLPVCRYDVDSISELLGAGYELRSSRLQEHRTPSGSPQQFVHVRFRRVAPD